MQNSTPPSNDEITRTPIRVLVTETDHKALKRKAVDADVNLSELGRVFFLEWLQDNPHALAIIKKLRK